MNKLIKRMNIETNDFREKCLNRTINENMAKEIIKRIINIAIDIYKDEDIKFFIPIMQTGERALYLEDESRAYVPIFTDKNSIHDDLIKEFKEVTFKELCDGLYENIRTYKDLDSIGDDIDPDWLIMHINDIKEMNDYAKNNPRISGIIYEPYSNNIFGFEDWMVEGIMFKGMGISDCVWLTEEGEKQYEI